jgi:GNAT superfamily N-acetyltransferase
MRFEPASRFGFDELAEIFNRGYEAYAVPMHVDADSLAGFVAAWDTDLDRSRVALDGAEPVGLAMIAVRGERGWVGGVGVAAGHRGRGVGRAMMEAVLANAPAHVTLEVIESNEPARRLYERLGFTHTRLLEVWTLKDAPLVEAQRVDPWPLGQPDVPWQRADESLPADYVRLELDGGAILLNGANVLQLAAPDADVAAKLLSRGVELHYVNVPEGDVASAALRALGGELQLRQFELALSSSSIAPTG